MSNRLVPWLLPLMLITSLAGVETWTVPRVSPPVVGDCIGFVEAERGKLATLFGPGNKMMIESFIITGSDVTTCQPVMTFNTTLLARDLPAKQADLSEAEIRYTLELLKLDRTRAELLDQQARARADLAAVRARLAALGTDDAADVALARAQADLAQATAQTAARARVRLAARASAGDATAQELADATHDAAQAVLAAEQAAAAANRVATRDRRSERGRMLLDEQRIMGDLGLVRTVDGREEQDPLQGLGARLAQNQASRAAQESGLAAERDARRFALHELQRSLHDHTPLAWIELLPAAGGEPRRWDLTAGVPAAGWQAESGAPFSADRGFGFDRDLRPALAGSGTKPEDTWCLIREPATWSALVPDGTYTLRVGVRADVDWDGAVIRATSANGLVPVFCRNRLAPDEHATASVAVTVVGGRLTLLLGGEPGKHLYAPVNGTFIVSPRSVRGLKIDSRTRTLGFVAAPAAVRINARVPADLAPLLAVPEAQAVADDPDLRRRFAIRQVRLTPPGQAACMGEVIEVGTKPAGIRLGQFGWNEDNPGDPQDLTHREAYIAVPAAAAQRIKLRSQVAIQLEALPPPGVMVVPPWMVAWRTSTAWIRTAAGWRQIQATRCGGQTLVTGLRPGEVLEVPTGEPPVATNERERSEPEGGYAGQVVAGERVRVVLKGGWGRVGTFIPDGSEVAEGDELLTLYNPMIDQQRNELDRQRREAERAFSQAAADRQGRLIEAGNQRRQDEQNEGRARWDASDARKADERLTEQRIAARKAIADAGHEATTLGATQALTSPPVGELADRQSAATRTQVAAERAAFDAALSANAKDWFAGARATVAWDDAFAILAQKEAKDLLARAEDRAATTKAAAGFERARQGQTWVTEFEKNKILRAPAKGRLYWLPAWNDQTRARGTLTKDVWIWQGVPVAEIVDLAHLSFTAELPEVLYPRFQVGQRLMVRFPVLGNRRIGATIAEVGQALGLPRDLATAATDEKITDLRVFTVTLALTLGPADHGVVQPGLRGILELP